MDHQSKRPRSLPATTYLIAWGLTATFAWTVVHLELPDYIAIGVPGVVAGCALFGLELVASRHRSWRKYWRDVPTDVVYVLVSGVAVSKLVEGAVQAGIVAWITVSTRALLDVWPRDLPFAAQLAIALLLSELVHYWMHRASHTWPLLWRLHAVHHRPRRLYFLNSNRFHPLETAILAALFTLPLVLLGAGREIILVHAAINGVNGLLTHSNVRIRSGPLRWILATNELHEWHHSRVTRESCTNYGANLILWDLVFGTHFAPADREPPEAVGVEGMDDRTTFLRDLVAPLAGLLASSEESRASERERIDPFLNAGEQRRHCTNERPSSELVEGGHR